MKTLFPIRKKRKTLIRAGAKSGEKKADRTGAITNQIGEPAASPLDNDLIEKNQARHSKITQPKRASKSRQPNGIKTYRQKGEEVFEVGASFAAQTRERQDRVGSTIAHEN